MQSLIYTATYVSSIGMTKINETYRCEVCGNKVKVVAAGAGELVCCGNPMTKIVFKAG